MESQTTAGFKCSRTFVNPFPYPHLIHPGYSICRFYHPSKFSASIFRSQTIFRVQLYFLHFRLYELYKSIDEFTSEDSNRQQIYEDLTIGMMCLGKTFGEYNRAKVTAIECNLERGILVTVFFVDVGQRSTLIVNELLAIPKYLVENFPFQVRDCRPILSLQ